MGTQNQTTIMWWLLCGFLSLWSEFFTRLHTVKPNPFSPLSSPPSKLLRLFASFHLFLATFSFLSAILRFHRADPMKEIADFVDPRIRLKHQILTQEYQELREETEYKLRKLEMMKQKRLTLDAEVRFLRRRYKHLKQHQTLETNPKMLRLSESGDVKVPIKPSLKRKKNSVPCSGLKQKNTIGDDKEALADNASCDLEKKPKRSRGNEVLTNSVPLPDLNGDGNTSVTVNKEPGFDLNQISREEEEPEANGEQMVAGATTKKAMLGNGIEDLHCEMKLPICRDVEKELNRAVKRKVTWQDPVALSV